MSATQTNQAVLLELGFRAGSAKEGLRDALQAVAAFKAQAALKMGELNRELRNADAALTVSRRRELERQLRDVQTMLRGATGEHRRAALEQQNAITGQLRAFSEHTARVRTLRTELRDLASEQRRASAAAGLFRETGRANGEIPGISDVLRGGLAQVSPQLAGILSQLQAITPAAGAGSSAVAALGGSAGATAGLLGLLAGAAAGVVGHLASASIETHKWADDLEELSQRTAIPVERLAELEFIGRATDLSLDDLVSVTRRLAKEMAAGNTVFERFGITIRDAGGNLREPFEVMLDIGDVLKNISDRTQRLAAAELLLGKSSQSVIPTLVLGREELAKMSAEVRALMPDITRAAAVYGELERSAARLEFAQRKANAEVSIFTQLQTAANELRLGIIKREAAGRTPMPRGITREFMAEITAPDVAPTGNVARQHLPTSPFPPSRRFDTEEITNARQRIEDQRRAFASAALADAKRLVAFQTELKALKEAEASEADAKLQKNLERQAEVEKEIHAIEQARIAARRTLGEAIAREREGLEKVLTDRNASLAFEAMKQKLGEVAATRMRELQIQAELNGLKSKEVALTGDELRENLAKQRELETGITAIVLARTRARNDEKAAIAESNRLLEEANRATGASTGALPAGVPSASDVLGLTNGKAPARLSELRLLMDGFGDFTEVISRFDAALARPLGQLAALIEGIGALHMQLAAITGSGSFGGNISALFRRGSGISGGQRLAGLGGLLGVGIGGGQLIAQLLSGGFSGPGHGALTGATLGIGGLAGFTAIAAAAGGFPVGAALIAMLSNPLTAVLGGGAAGIGALLGAKRKQTRKIAQQIREEIKDSLEAFNEGRASLKSTISELERERAAAVARLSGRKGGGQELAAITAEIDRQLSDLRSKQRQILEDFNQQLAILTVPEGGRDAAEAIAQIARQLKVAGDAGATAAQQLDFLNRSLAELASKIGRDLRDEELETIELLREQIDLTKQREQVEKDAAEAELNVRRRFGLARALTPEQQAAAEIKAIRERKAEQLAEIEEREKLLRAELEGRAELFGLDLQGLDVTAQRNLLLDRQVTLQRSITAELVEQIRLQQGLFADLAAGRIPQLPAGIFPSGFTFPSGGSPITITIGTVNTGGGAGDRQRLEDEFYELFVRAHGRAAARQRMGFSS